MPKESKIGRPEALNASYFSHSVNESDSLKIMYRKYGYEGYTALFRLQEQAAKADYHRIELKNDTQKHIFMMNMDVRQEVIDFLIDVLLQIGEIDREQWELNKTIYLNKFVLQFKKLWFDRGKSIPDAKGNFINYRPEKDLNRVSLKGKGNNRVQYNKSKIEENNNDKPLCLSDYEKLFSKKDLSFVGKYLKENPNPKHSKAMELCELELKTRPISFGKTPTGLFVAWCSKCGNKEFPNELQIKNGSECCRVEYANENPKNQQSSSLISKKDTSSNNV